MTTRNWLGTSLCLALASFATTACQSTTDSTMRASYTQEEMMAKAQEMGTPGPAHKILDHRTGRWDMTMTMYMDPATPPMTSKGTCEMKWILNGHYIEDNTTSDFMGMPFQGRGTTGYDNAKQKYTSTWVDSMSTAMMTAEGTYDASTKTWNYTTEYTDCMTGEPAQGRIVEKMIDNDHMTMEMYGPGLDGKEMKMMEIQYVRAK